MHFPYRNSDYCCLYLPCLRLKITHRPKCNSSIDYLMVFLWNLNFMHTFTFLVIYLSYFNRTVNTSQSVCICVFRQYIAIHRILYYIVRASMCMYCIDIYIVSCHNSPIDVLSSKRQNCCFPCLLVCNALI